MQIVWLPKAVENLKNIQKYIEAENPKSASKVAKQIQKRECPPNCVNLSK
jgi:plasmid stabilization system protein ParE